MSQLWALVARRSGCNMPLLYDVPSEWVLCDRLGGWVPPQGVAGHKWLQCRWCGRVSNILLLGSVPRSAAGSLGTCVLSL